MKIQTINTNKCLTNTFYNTKNTNFKRFSPSFCADTFVLTESAKSEIEDKKIVNMPQKSDYVDCATIKDAKEFALEKFGIKAFNVKNLQIANYVNAGLTNAVNKTHGKAILFDKIVEYDKPCDWIQCTYDKTLLINPQVMTIECLDDLEYTLSLKDRKNYLNADFLQKIEFINNCIVQQDAIKPSLYHHLYHELGHLNHKNQNFKKFNYYLQAGTGSSYMDEYGKTGRFNNMMIRHIDLCDKKLKDDFLLIGVYALIFPVEFVAEMYAYLMSDASLPKEFYDIYKKYGGPVI